MLPILLMVLKAAGIAVLALLGILFFLLLLVLLVPVRYSVSGSYYGKLRGTASITWLLRGVSLKATYEDKLEVVIRIFGKRLFQKQEGPDEVSRDIEDGLRAAGEVFEEAGEAFPVDFVENAGEDGGTEEEPPEKVEHSTPSEKQGGRDKNGENEKTVNDDSQGSIWDFAEDEEDSAWELSEDAADGPEDEAVYEEVLGSGGLVWKKKAGKGKESRDKKRRNKEKKSETGKGSPTESQGPAERLKQLEESVKGKWEKLNGYKEKAVSFWNDEANQKTIKVILRQVKAVVRHVLPRKARGKVVFGFDNPGTTGKVLSALSVAYAWYGDKIEIVPVFGESILEGEGSLKGRVQAGVIGARCVRVLLNKNFRKLAWSFIKNGGR